MLAAEPVQKQKSGGKNLFLVDFFSRLALLGLAIDTEVSLLHTDSVVRLTLGDLETG